MASHVDPLADESIALEDHSEEDLDRTDEHLLMALEATVDRDARYHLREALQLTLAPTDPY